METVFLKEPALESNKWSAVPETKSVEIYPIIRKPCVTCSNTFILKSDLYIIIIDPGAEREQIEHIRRTVLSARNEKLRPVFIFLTHCHIDHCLSINLLMDEEPGGRLICHSEAAKAIENRDESITLANMNGSVLPVCRASACLFEKPDKPDMYKKHPFAIENGNMELEDGNIVPLHIFPISSNDKIEVLHTPGHSPDSVSYRIGSLLITGDLHLATTPGIAGKSGWDNDKLAVSLKAVLEKGRKDCVSLVLPGHGSALGFDKAQRIFESARKDALKLKGISLFNRERSLYISEYATVLLEEASNIFSIIAARLLKTSYYLEMLEEQEKAAEILGIIDIDSIDNTINDFHIFFDELKGKRGAPLISKAVFFSRKVNKIFEPEILAGFLDPYFIHRIKSLLSDFVNVVYGISYKDQESIFDLNTAVSGTLSSIMKDPTKEEKIFETLDDDREFIKELTKRIAYTPLFSSTLMTFDPVDEQLLVTADKLIFQDMLTALFEQFAISEIPHVFLRTSHDVDNTVLSITPGHSDKSSFDLRESKMLYLQHSMRLAGGEFRKNITNGIETFHYIFPDNQKSNAQAQQ